MALPRGGHTQTPDKHPMLGTFLLLGNDTGLQLWSHTAAQQHFCLSLGKLKTVPHSLSKTKLYVDLSLWSLLEQAFDKKSQTAKLAAGGTVEAALEQERASRHTKASAKLKAKMEKLPTRCLEALEAGAVHVPRAFRQFEPASKTKQEQVVFFR